MLRICYAAIMMMIIIIIILLLLFWSGWSSHFLAVPLVQLPVLVLVIPAVHLSIVYAMLDPRFSSY